MSDLPLQFHDFKHLDHTKRCPKFTAILTKSPNGSVQPNELDEVYTDLESLLGAANIRHRQLESELKILGEIIEKSFALKSGKLKLGRFYWFLAKAMCIRINLAANILFRAI